MSSFFKGSLFFIFFTSLLHGGEWKLEKNFDLKKDEVQYIKIKTEKSEKIFFFRWTLFHNNALVLLKTYDDEVSQNMLYLRYHNRSVTIKLKDVSVQYGLKPYLLLKFSSFDYKTKKAKLTLFLLDDNDQVELEFIKRDKLNE